MWQLLCNFFVGSEKEMRYPGRAHWVGCRREIVYHGGGGSHERVRQESSSTKKTRIIDEGAEEMIGSEDRSGEGVWLAWWRTGSRFRCAWMGQDFQEGGEGI